MHATFKFGISYSSVENINFASFLFSFVMQPKQSPVNISGGIDEQFHDLIKLFLICGKVSVLSMAKTTDGK